jgi:hypothetical protein
MHRDVEILVWRGTESPLASAIRLGIYDGYAEYEPSFFEEIIQRGIAAKTLKKLSRRDHVFGEQCRQSCDVAERMEISLLDASREELAAVVSEMIDLGLLGNETDEIPPELIAKYADYRFYPPKKWKKSGKLGSSFLIQVGDDYGGPVVVRTDINDPKGVSLHQNTWLVTIGELMKFSQEPIIMTE